MYKSSKAIVIDPLPITNKINTIVEYSWGINAVAMIETAATENVENNRILRRNRWHNGNANKRHGISMATTIIKLT